jgi:hypothetical protein
VHRDQEDEPMIEKKRVPVCPNCKAKFAHDAAKRECRSCGIPDEIIALGPQTMQRWKKDKLRALGFSRRHAKDTAKKVGGGKSRPKNKHGRSGVRR